MKKFLTILFMTCVLSVVVTGCTSTPKKDNTATPPAEENVTDETKTNEEVVTDEETISGNGQTSIPTVTEKEAKEIALAHSNFKESDVTFHSVKLDTEDGYQVYEVDFYTDDKEYDYDIDSKTGDILRYHYEVRNRKNNSNTSNKIISEKDAEKVALESVKGSDKSHLTLRLESDDGIRVYEGTILYNNRKYEFEINAETGAIEEWEEEITR